MPSTREKFPQLGLWDNEVSKPSHDTIVNWAYNNAEQLARQYVSSFASHFEKRGIDLRPEWPQPLLDKHPELPQPPIKPATLVSKRERGVVLRERSNHMASRYSPRILGYGDLLLHCEAQVLGISEIVSTRKKEWWLETIPFKLLVEVKAELPTAGELMRQLNLYRESVHQIMVIAPDAKYAELLFDQGILFIQYDSTVGS